MPDGVYSRERIHRFGFGLGGFIGAEQPDWEERKRDQEALAGSAPSQFLLV